MRFERISEHTYIQLSGPEDNNIEKEFQDKSILLNTVSKCAVTVQESNHRDQTRDNFIITAASPVHQERKGTWRSSSFS